MAGFLLAAFPGIFATYIFALALLQRTQSLDEPPAIDTSIPFVSPILAMISIAISTIILNTNNGHWPMYTLRLPFIRLDVRHVRTISFAPVLVRMASAVMGVSPDAAKIISENHPSDDGFVHGMTSAIRPTLSPGPKLNLLNRNAVQTIATSLDKVARTKTTLRLNLVEWVYHQVMIATTDGVYGPQNPFRDPVIQKAFFTYERGSFHVRKSVQARNILGHAFRRYFDEAGHDDPEPPALIKAKHDFFSARGIANADIARIEVTGTLALLSNTMPATFWLIYHLYSDTELLNACRAELEQAIQESDGTHLIDMACVKNGCPLLFSTFQEVLRCYGIGISTRMVLEDTGLDHQFLVRKGGMVFIPGAGHHHLRSVWGENADEFSARRFLQNTGKLGRGYDPVAFRAFGGGSTLCPGRHFAATEILAFASFIVLRFDAKPSGGRWVPPTTEKTALGTTIRQPDYGIMVELRARDDHKWAVRFSEADQPMHISAEDISSTQENM
ncbi:cytochrome P450 [Nemania sp. NC0429]|nr:cytochrome P450 [Nemania sp. NC0429]